MGRWLAVDYGLRRIGLAVGDQESRVTAGLKTIQAEKTAPKNAALIIALAKNEAYEGIVVGLPLQMDGTDSEQTRLTRIFFDQLAAMSDLTVVLHDERLTSFQADLDMENAGFSRKKRKEMRDTIAARQILQSFFDSRDREKNAEVDFVDD